MPSVRQTVQNGDNYLRDSHLKGPDIRAAGDMAPLHLPTHQHTHCLICTLPIQHPPCSGRRRRQRQGKSFLAGQHHNAIPMPKARIVSGIQRCADRKSLIRVSLQSSTKDRRPQTLAICNLESALWPHLNATYCT